MCGASTQPAWAESSRAPNGCRMEYALALIALAAIVFLVVTVPLRRPESALAPDEARIEELEAAKEAKYREIRDSELDKRMGKLSEEDWRGLDRELRGEAIEVLQELDRLQGRPHDAA